MNHFYREKVDRYDFFKFSLFTLSFICQFTCTCINNFIGIRKNDYINAFPACIKHNIPRLVYTSTCNVVFGGKIIENGDESLPYFPIEKVNELIWKSWGNFLITACFKRNRFKVSHVE